MLSPVSQRSNHRGLPHQRANYCLLATFLFSLFPAFVPMLSQAAEQKTSDEKVVYLGIINKRANNKQYDLHQYGKLVEYIGRELGKTSDFTAAITIARNQDDLARLINIGKINLLMEGVIPTLRMQKITGKLEPAMLSWRKGQRQYHSVFFARKGSGINKLEDLRGKTIAFEAPRSTSAFFVPWAALQESGIELSSLPVAQSKPTDVSYVFAGTELNQAFWVHRGRVDAGAFNNGDWQRLPANLKDNLKVFYETQPILRWIISFNLDLPQPIRAELRAILTKMHETEEGRQVLKASERTLRIDALTAEDLESLADWRRKLDRMSISF